MDWWTKFEGKEQEFCIQGRRVTKSLANAGRFTSVIVQGSTRVKRSTRQCCRGVERIRVSRGAATFFPLAASYRFCGGGRPGKGVSGARRGLRHEGAVQERWERGRELKEKGESCWKNGGGRVRLYTW